MDGGTWSETDHGCSQNIDSPTPASRALVVDQTETGMTTVLIDLLGMLKPVALPRTLQFLLDVEHNSHLQVVSVRNVELVNGNTRMRALYQIVPLLGKCICVALL